MAYFYSCDALVDWTGHLCSSLFCSVDQSSIFFYFGALCWCKAIRLCTTNSSLKIGHWWSLEIGLQVDPWWSLLSSNTQFAWLSQLLFPFHHQFCFVFIFLFSFCFSLGCLGGFFFAFNVQGYLLLNSLEFSWFETTTFSVRSHRAWSQILTTSVHYCKCDIRHICRAQYQLSAGDRPAVHYSAVMQTAMRQRGKRGYEGRQVGGVPGWGKWGEYREET